MAMMELLTAENVFVNEKVLASEKRRIAQSCCGGRSSGTADYWQLFTSNSWYRVSDLSGRELFWGEYILAASQYARRPVINNSTALYL